MISLAKVLLNYPQKALRFFAKTEGALFPGAPLSPCNETRGGKSDPKTRDVLAYQLLKKQTKNR